MLLLNNFILIMGWSLAPATAESLSSYVNPMVGSEGEGHNFPGVSRPFGIVKMGPDVVQGDLDAYAGYLPQGEINGFSMLHLSGDGGAPMYGVVSQMPAGDGVKSFGLDTVVKDKRAMPDMAEVGYYKTSLASGVTVELAGTEKAGMYRYLWPKKKFPAPVIVVDVHHALGSHMWKNLEQHYKHGSLEVTDGGKRYIGSAQFENGWNRASIWTVHFCGHFDDPAPQDYQTFKNAQLERGGDKVESDQPVGARFFFSRDERIITSRVGVSFISTEQACANVESQIPPGTTLTSLILETRAAWNKDVFSKITTTDNRSSERLEQLYTSLYHMHLHPTDKTGENQAWQSDEPYYDDISTFWHLSRCATALLHILQPGRYTGLIRSLIDTWRHTGYLPDSRIAFSNGATQGGSNADNVLADAYVKGVRAGVDWEDGLSAMLADADEQPPGDGDPRDRHGSVRHGRGALDDWRADGFLTTAQDRSVSRTVEYSANDFCVWQVARGVGRAGPADPDAYLRRSRNWRNLWDADATSLGHRGFLQPRDPGKALQHHVDPRFCSRAGDAAGCDWGGLCYHGSLWSYSFGAHHDMAELVARAGGRERFVERLDAFFAPANGLQDQWNPTAFTTPYLYSFADRQDLTVAAVRKIARERFQLKPDGLSGASGGGAMESWLLWAMIGLYPMTGQTTFLIGSPWFTDLTIDLGGGKNLVIKAEGESDTTYYVQRLKVNGKEWYQNWLTWEDIFAQGGTLDFVLGPEPVIWAVDDVPPSPATGL